MGSADRPRMMKTLGLMSGTSMDGIDLALVETDGEDRVVPSLKTGQAMAIPYESAFAKRIAAALEDAKLIGQRHERPNKLAEIEEQITRRHADAVKQLICRNNRGIDVIGFHGQTVLHRPEIGLTVQLGDGQLLADLTGIPVIYDMRAADMRAGGQGAPLVPVYHQVLANMVEERPVAYVNIGGISNITYIGKNGELLAFDTGPGNALIDQWVQSEAGVPYDAGGGIAREGVVARTVVDRYLANDFFKKSGPKSLDRNDFQPLEGGSLELSDGARTLTRVTAEAIVAATDHLPSPPKHWILCGGGRLNKTLHEDMRELADKTAGKVSCCEAFGLDGDMMEAEAFGYLAVRSLKSLPLTFPDTTGCRRPVTGGVLAKPGV
ncbi:MAG: anhydro-N-acetylmuramic acid kinase [Rhizobiaceae bacterium]